MADDSSASRDTSAPQPPPPPPPAAASGAPAAETSSGDADQDEPSVTFKVKTSSSDRIHTITMPLSATVAEIKTRLASDAYEDIPVDRQRLIYSGRVMKNDDALSVYKIKDGNTVHLVKSAASNQSGAAASGASASTAATPSAPGTGAAAQGVPQNMASGTANNPLAALTGARFAGMANLPDRDMFGPDGGLGAPPSQEEMARIMNQPGYQQMMAQLLDNPEMLEMAIQSHPLLRTIPGARDLLRSPLLRGMLTNPGLMTAVNGMRRTMTPGEAFPAPGATDTTPPDAPASDRTTTAAAGSGPGLALAGDNPFLAMFNQAGAAGAAGAAGPGAPPMGNPMMRQTLQHLFGEAATNTVMDNDGATNPLDMSALMALLGGGPGQNAAGAASAAAAAAAPPDNRPPEERYEAQLRQLNDMGFYDFDRNVAALRRSGGSVQGAIEHLLGGA